MADINQIEQKITNIREWLEQGAPECFTEQKHTEEGTQERIYWHHGYMTGLRDALRLFAGDYISNQRSHIRGTPTKSFSA